MVTKLTKSAVLVASLSFGLLLGFSTFAIMFNTSIAESIGKLVVVFVGVFAGSIAATYALKGKSWEAIALLAGPSILTILIPIIAVNQTPEVYRGSAIEIAILIACALVGPAAFALVKKPIAKQN